MSESSRCSFLFTILSTTVLVLMMTTMTSAQSLTLSFKPKDVFKIGDKLEITCSYPMENLISFKLMRNDTEVVNIEYIIDESSFKIKSEKEGFKCDLPTASSNVLINCQKNALRCEDVAWYKFVTTNHESPSVQLKVKSFISSLDIMNPPATENQIAIFRCGANVAIPTNNAARFVWTVKRGNNMVDELRIEKRENVPSKSTCITTVYSEFEYNVTLLDRSNTTITCTAYSESLSRSFAIPDRFPPTEGPVITDAGGLKGGEIAGIVLGIIALIILVVLLIWFFVIRKKGDKPASKETTSGPKPIQKDYHVQDNAIYLQTDKLKHSEPSEMLTDNPIHEKAKGSRRHHPKKDSKFLPSHGDPTDQMDELDEPYPPPPPPPPPPQSKPNLPQHAGLHDQLHYAELQHAVEDSRTRRSNFIRRAETPYAEVDIANLTKD